MKLGAHVRKGERGETVVYYGQASRTHGDAQGGLHPSAQAGEKEDGFRFLKCYVAFNADQIEGLPDCYHPAPRALPPMPLPMHEAWFARLEIARILTRDQACY